MTEAFWARLAAWFINGVRTFVQAGWAWLIAHVPPVAAVLGALTPDQQSAVREWVIGVLTAAGVAAMAAAVHWLSTRTGEARWARFARWLGNVLMLGLNRFMPAYADLRDPNGKPAAVEVYAVNAAGKMTGETYSQPTLKE